MAYMKPGRFKTIMNRRRQWRLLEAVLPDVALLQECRPDDLATLAPGWMADEYDIIGRIPDGWIACSAVLARKSLRAAPFDRGLLPERRWLEFFSGYIATARLAWAGIPINVASVHEIAAEVDNAAVTEMDHCHMQAISVTPRLVQRHGRRGAAPHDRRDAVHRRGRLEHRRALRYDDATDGTGQR